MEREISAGIIIYRKTPEGPKFLLLYHGHNYWNFPKGKLESEPRVKNGVLIYEREKSFHAAVREIREETGLTRSDLKFNGSFKTSEKFTYWSKIHQEKVFKIVIFYLAETSKKDIKLSDEHEGFGWFTYREALRALSNRKGNKTVLKQAYEVLKKSFSSSSEEDTTSKTDWSQSRDWRFINKQQNSWQKSKYASDKKFEVKRIEKSEDKKIPKNR